MSKPDRPEIDERDERRERLAEADAVPSSREHSPFAVDASEAAGPSGAAERRPEDPGAAAVRSEAPGGGVMAGRQGKRGDRGQTDEQGVDPVALETWVGSGEATDLFSQVFGGFLPAEGAARGFFGRLIDRLEGFPDRIAGRTERNDGRAPEAGEAPRVHLHRAGTAMRPNDEDVGSVELLDQGRGGPDRPALDEPRRLDATTRERMEQALGGDFTRVRIHTGPGAAEAARRYAADALTIDDHIFFAPGRFNPNDSEGQRLLAHELAHVLQKGRKNLDVRTAESEARAVERSFGQPPPMETLDLSRPKPDFKLPDGDGSGVVTGAHTAKRSRSRGYEAGGKDELPDGEELLEKVSDRVYALLLAELEESFESR